MPKKRMHSCNVRARCACATPSTHHVRCPLRVGLPPVLALFDPQCESQINGMAMMGIVPNGRLGCSRLSGEFDALTRHSR